MYECQLSEAHARHAETVGSMVRNMTGNETQECGVQSWGFVLVMFRPAESMENLAVQVGRLGLPGMMVLHMAHREDRPPHSTELVCGESARMIMSCRDSAKL